MDEPSKNMPDFSDPGVRERWLQFLRVAYEYSRQFTQDLPSNAANPHDTEGE